MNLYQSVKAVIAEIVVEFKNAQKDGFTIQEVMTLIHMVISSLMTAAQSMFDCETGNFKKTAVLEALGYAYDDYLQDLIQKSSGIPKYLFPIFDKIAKQFILWIAEWAIDGIYDEKVQSVGMAGSMTGNPFFSELSEEEQEEVVAMNVGSAISDQDASQDEKQDPEPSTEVASGSGSSGSKPKKATKKAGK